jgi:hypothetical protein
MGDYGYDEEFNTPEELEDYARRVLGPKFDKKRHRKRAKLEAKAELKNTKSNKSSKSKEESSQVK